MSERKIIRNHLHDTVRDAKRSYKAKKRLAIGRYRRERLAMIERSGKPAPADPPKRSVLAEIGNAVTHGIGALFATVAFALMLLRSGAAREYAGAAIYFGGLFWMFTASCLYHAFPHGSAVKRLFRRFDYTGIYLLIGATFAPPLLNVVGGAFGTVFFIIQWAVIAFGITFVGVFGPSRFRFIHIPLYVALGWSALLLMPWLIGESFALAMWILAGGIIYTLGIIPYMIKMKTAHFIWHFFVLAGAAVQWVGIYLYIYPA